MMSFVVMMLNCTVEAGTDAGGSMFLHVLLPWQRVEQAMLFFRHEQRAVVHAVVHLQEFLVNLLTGLVRLAASRSEMEVLSTTVTAPV